MTKRALGNSVARNRNLFIVQNKRAAHTAAGYYCAPSVAALVADRKPDLPIHCLNLAKVREQARFFIENFPGQPIYAVKCNPHPLVLQTLRDAGFTGYDVASLPEIEAVRAIDPFAKLYFMHPVKSRPAIRAAYFKYRVRDFVLDSHDELQKILEETDHAADLNLHVRISLPKGKAYHALTNKFGIGGADAIALIIEARKHAVKFGLSFHVGSQTTEPEPYAKAIAIALQLVADAGVKLDSLDVGGGFPVSYPDLPAAPLPAFMQTIKDALQAADLPENCAIICEPGRALVAEAGSLLTKIELRKDDMLYINDGAYGALFDAAFTDLCYPVKLHRLGDKAAAINQPFGFYGPTCDSLDIMKGPFQLPTDSREGDWVEIQNLGAYGFALQSRFNGFGAEETVIIG